MNENKLGIILNDEQDERTLTWLRSRFSDAQLLTAVQRIKTTSKRKLFLTNICRELNVEAPLSVRNPQAAEMFKLIQATVEKVRMK